jgi:16S rRNA (guanine1207-N2)-methyltransferase
VANGVADRVRVTRDDAASTVADASVDLVVCNPPFHLGAAVVTGAADRLFAAAGRVLRPGGELWSVYNNRLPHRAALRRLVGPTQVAPPTGGSPSPSPPAAEGGPSALRHGGPRPPHPS